jgi:hypothetical protein
MPRAQLVAHRRVDARVAAGHLVAGLACQCSQAAHEGAANAQDMNVHGRFYGACHAAAAVTAHGMQAVATNFAVADIFGKSPHAGMLRGAAGSPTAPTGPRPARAHAQAGSHATCSWPLVQGYRTGPQWVHVCTVTAEIAQTAARLVVEEGLEWGPAKRRAVRQLGCRSAPLAGQRPG